MQMVLQKSLSAGVEVAGLREDLQALGLIVEPFSAADADTAARLAVGSTGQVLTVDSTTATGLKWATPSGINTGKAIAMAMIFGF